MSAFAYLKLVLVVHLICCSRMGIFAMENAAKFVQITSCTCLGYVVTYECTIGSGLGTVWNGGVFNCSSSGNEIYLLGSNLNSVTCNNGMITGKVVRSDNASVFYTSQLSITASSELIGKNVSCAQHDGTTTELIGSATIIAEAPFKLPQAPSLISTDLSLRYATFAWTPVAPNSDCPVIHYDTVTSNCGSCPTTTNNTTVTCVDIPTDGSTCAFAVRVVICGNVTGNVSDEARGVFKGTSTIVNSGCAGATASASIFAIGLTISIIVFTSIIIVLIKANKRASRIDLATRRRARLSRYEEEDPTHQPRTAALESTVNTSIYDDMDYEIAKVAVMATNKNIAYADTIMAIEQIDSNVEEHEYAQIHQL